jgi:hypothetical protein
MSTMYMKGLSIVVVAAGLLLVLASLAADAMGTGGSPGFGFRQILGTIMGLVLIVAGITVWPKADDDPRGGS